MVKNPKTNEFQGLNDGDRIILDKIPSMEETLFKIERPRNPRFHRKYFAMINLAFENQDDFGLEEAEQFRQYLQMRAGFYITKDTPTGNAYFAKSIAFDSMDGAEFENLYEKVWEQIFTLYKHDRSEFEAELNALA